MKLEKIVGLIGIALAVVAVFVAVPHVDLILLIVGLIIGWSIAREDHTRVIVSALALTGFAHLFGTVPEAGQYLSALIANLGLIASGAAVMIVLRNAYERFSPVSTTATKSAS